MNKSAFTTLFSLLLFFVLLVPNAYAQSSITLSASETATKTGQSFTVAIDLSITEPALGTDVVLQFNPTYLKAETIKKGTIYPEYPNIENAISPSGEIRISGLNSGSVTPTAQGNFAVVTFTPIAPGNTAISLVYAPGDTTKSGIISETGTNLLTSAPTPLNLSITGNPLATPTPKPANGSTTSKIQVDPKTNPAILPIIATIAVILLLILFTLFIYLKRRKPSTVTYPQPQAPVNPPSKQNPENNLYARSGPPINPSPLPVDHLPVVPPALSQAYPTNPIPQQILTPVGVMPPPLPQNHQNIDQILHTPQINTPPLTPNPEDSFTAQ